MKLAELVLVGTVTDRVERTGRNDRGPWRMVTVHLVGRRTAYAVTLPESLQDSVKVGDDVALSCYVRVYNERVDFAAVGLWDGVVGDVQGDEHAAARGA